MGHDEKVYYARTTQPLTQRLLSLPRGLWPGVTLLAGRAASSHSGLPWAQTPMGPEIKSPSTTEGMWEGSGAIAFFPLLDLHSLSTHTVGTH